MIFVLSGSYLSQKIKEGTFIEAPVYKNKLAFSTIDRRSKIKILLI
jgi:hypothetical protein